MPPSRPCTQDWLTKTFTELNLTQANFTAARDWLNAMGGAATELNVTIQFCMPLPGLLMHTTTMEAVTNARATGE